MNASKRPKPKLAQAMVEFALVLPILLMLILGIIEFARLLYAWIAIENATRFGIRYATTGNYDLAHCTDLDGNGTPCDGVSQNQEVDAARIPSIKDEARRVIIGLHYHYLDGATQSDVEYLNLTVCSNRVTESVPPQSRVFTPPQMGRPVYSSCLPSEDAGLPGQTVVVAADYNFTFIVLPIFGIRPSMIHLASYREGVVEQFRVSRGVNTPMPLSVPTVPSRTASPSPSPTITNTPTDTATPTSTPTATDTPTATRTPTSTNTPTVTFTPTITRTPTMTPVPSCSNLRVTDISFGTSEFRVDVQNSNVAPAYLINSSLIWNRVGTMTLNSFRFIDATPYFDPNPNLTTSPVSAAAPSILLGGGASDTWRARFGNSPVFQGYYQATLTFSFPNWGNCTLTAVITQLTPTPSLTPTITRTRAPTRTPGPTLTPSITPIPSRTPLPTATGLPTSTRTPTDVPPPTPVPSRTPTRTNTPIVPPTPTRTRTPTPTPLPTFCPDC